MNLIKLTCGDFAVRFQSICMEDQVPTHQFCFFFGGAEGQVDSGRLNMGVVKFWWRGLILYIIQGVSHPPLGCF